jgi:hypothetical protein
MIVGTVTLTKGKNSCFEWHKNNKFTLILPSLSKLYWQPIFIHLDNISCGILDYAAIYFREPLKKIFLATTRKAVAAQTRALYPI